MGEVVPFGLCFGFVFWFLLLFWVVFDAGLPWLSMSLNVTFNVAKCDPQSVFCAGSSEVCHS